MTTQTTPVRRLARLPLALLGAALRPVTHRYRAFMNAPVHAQMQQQFQQLHTAVDAGVMALAARASVLDAAVSRIGAQLTALDSAIPAQLDALEAGQKRLDGQQRLVFDGLLDEMALAQREMIATQHDTTATLLAQRDVMAAQHGTSATLLAMLERVEQYSHAAARRVAISCDGDVLVRSAAGYIVCAGSDLSVLATLIETGELERGTGRLIEALLQPGDCFVDVGANIGMHTLAAGRALQRRGAIHAFEPFEATRLQLQKSVWLNGLAGITTIHPNAVANRTGTQTLYLGASSGHHSLFALDQEGGKNVEVHTVRLDDVVTERVTLLKIDAEGAELDVLAGAHALVENNPGMALIVECGPEHLVRSGYTIDTWLAAFAALGLAWRTIDPDTGVLSATTPALLGAAESTNLLFARPGAPCWTNLLEQA